MVGLRKGVQSPPPDSLPPLIHLMQPVPVGGRGTVKKIAGYVTLCAPLQCVTSGEGANMLALPPSVPALVHVTTLMIFTVKIRLV